MKPYIALIKIDLKLAMRNRAVIFFNYLFPLIFFFIFAQANHAEQGGAITQIVAMVATIGVIGNGLFGAGMRAVQERENNTLRRYKVTPIGPLPLLVASMATGLMLYLPYVVLMLTLATQIYHMPVPKELIPMLIFISIGVVAFRSLGLIIASVVNSMQESVILVQILYFAMLFLSGATFPITDMPHWVQIVTQFIPASYLVSGLEGILLRNEGLVQNASSVIALFVAIIVATFVCTKIFRWEKEEKLKPAAKLWVVAALLPFFVLGGIQAYTNDNVEKAKITERMSRRDRTRLIRNARIFIGDGKIIESGSILIKRGKIEAIYEGAAPDPKTLDADPLEASGKTILPGLVDVHTHIIAPGGIPDASYNPNSDKYFLGALAAYLYSGVTAVKSVGDPLDRVLTVRTLVNSGSRLGSEFFICGPLFTTENGHGTEYFKRMPKQYQAQALAQFTRLPKTPEEGRKMVDDLKAKGVDGVKAILETGAAGTNFNRLDINILNAIADESRKQGLPITVHTGDSKDVADALAAGVNGIEHGSFRDKIPDELFAQMAKQGVYYDPTLSVAEGFRDLRDHNPFLLSRSLVQQVGPKSLLDSTMKYLKSGAKDNFDFPISLPIGQENLVRAWKAGVTLVTGSDAGNPMVFHGPTTQREIELWVEAGIPANIAIQAATSNSAKFLGAGNRFGTIQKGYEATLLVVDGNPLQDPRALESISNVFLKGERVDRSELFDQK
jgi:imidazolonepropionase-like amidohydrolase/ABC-type multidrug transport system permease subunit